MTPTCRLAEGNRSLPSRISPTVLWDEYGLKCVRCNRVTYTFLWPSVDYRRPFFILCRGPELSGPYEKLPRKGGESTYMPTQAKAEKIEELTEKLGRAAVTILVQTQGLTVKDMTDLRNRMRAAKIEFQVAKNT